MNDYEERVELVKLALDDAILIVDEKLDKRTSGAVIAVFERLLPNDTIVRLDHGEH